MNVAASPKNWASVTQKHAPSIVGFYYASDDESAMIRNVVTGFKELERVSIDVSLAERDYWVRFTPMASDYIPCVVTSTADDLIDHYKTIGHLLVNLWDALEVRRQPDCITLPPPSTNPSHWSIRKAIRLNNCQPEWLIQDLRGIPVAGYSYNDGVPEWFTYIRLDADAVKRIKQLKQNSNAK